jgi:indoleamine 2,3-dioxygenase
MIRRNFTNLLKSSHYKDKSIPQFTVGIENGFLPRLDPVVDIGREFKPLDDLLKAMPLTLPDGGRGLLAKGEFGNAVKDLPELKVDHITDTGLLTGTFISFSIVPRLYIRYKRISS